MRLRGKKKKIALASLAAGMIILAAQAALAQGEARTGSLKRGWFPAWLKASDEKIDLSFGVIEEYDDNVFLEESDPEWDWKTTLTPAVYFQQQWDKLYLKLGHQAEATYFRRLSHWVITQQSDTELSFTPTERWAIGVKDTHIHAGQAYAYNGDERRILRLGFNINTMLAQSKHKLTDKLTLVNEYQFDYINFSDPTQDIYVDRKSHEPRVRLEYEFIPNFTALAGYSYRNSDYQHPAAEDKDYSAAKAQAGMRYKARGLFTWEGIVEEEWRNFAERKNKHHLNVKTGITSIFSRFTSAGLNYSHAMADSSRGEFRQYYSDRLTFNFRHYLTPRNILFLRGGYERQLYKDPDRITTSIDPGSRRTFLYTGDATLRRLFNNWLSGEISYHYSKRDTAFVREGHTNNRYSVGLRGRW